MPFLPCILPFLMLFIYNSVFVSYIWLVFLCFFNVPAHRPLLRVELSQSGPEIFLTEVKALQPLLFHPASNTDITQLDSQLIEVVTKALNSPSPAKNKAQQYKAWWT